MSTISEFRAILAARLRPRNIEVLRWGHGHSPHLLELSSEPTPTLLYVKEFNVQGRFGFWGLTRNQIKRIEQSRCKWCVVLLLRSATEGYVLPSDQVVRHIRSGTFELSADGDYKVNENSDLTVYERFSGVDTLIARML